jgi:hypothetical protein
MLMVADLELTEVGTDTTAVPGLTRTDLQRHDLSIPGREVIQNRVDIAPDAQPRLTRRSVCFRKRENEEQVLTRLRAGTS